MPPHSDGAMAHGKHGNGLALHKCRHCGLCHAHQYQILRCNEQTHNKAEWSSSGPEHKMPHVPHFADSNFEILKILKILKMNPRGLLRNVPHVPDFDCESARLLFNVGFDYI
jgi:hypothetical protein